MLRLTCSLLLFPVALLAQTPAPQPKPAAAGATAKPAPAPARPAPKPAAAPATRKPAATTARPATASAPALVTDEQKVIYAVGLLMQQSLGQFDLSPAELDIVKRALSDAAAGKPAIQLDDFGPKIEPLARARGARIATREKAASLAYLAKAAAETGASRTASGLVFRDLVVGTGAAPSAADRVRVHYRGTLINGTEFDSSYARNEPTEFALRGVIPCWTEGVQRMKVGGKARLVCPSDIAYGDAGSGPIPGGAALIFEIELLAVLN